MFIERKRNPTNGQIELWACEWQNRAGGRPQKVFVTKVADEQPLKPEGDDTKLRLWSTTEGERHARAQEAQGLARGGMQSVAYRCRRLDARKVARMHRLSLSPA